MCSYVSMKEVNVIDVRNISFKTARIILHLISFPQFLFELFHIVTSITRTMSFTTVKTLAFCKAADVPSEFLRSWLWIIVSWLIAYLIKRVLQ